MVNGGAWARSARSALAAVAALTGLAGCASTDTRNLPRGEAAYATIPAIDPKVVPEEYVIGAFDEIDVSVFREPDVSLRNVSVDASGRVTMPLIGAVQAAGRTAAELSRDIEVRLGGKYLVDPQVTVAVNTSATQQVTVEGSVNVPGVYGVKGQVSLLDALAMARGPSRTASLNRTIVFRQVDGKRAAAVFDINEIRRGAMPDPTLLAGDRVVVTNSRTKSAFLDIITATPAIGLFTLLR